MRCMWCTGDFEDIDGPVHEYMESTPGCWAAYTRVLALQYENYQLLHDVHHLTADTYAVQHPGEPSRKSIQSVCAHLVAQHFYLDRGLDGDTTRAQLKRFLDSEPEMAWLEPPDFAGTVNVGYVLAATGEQDHMRRVREWGTSVYGRWRERHGVAIDDMVRRTFGPKPS